MALRNNAAALAASLECDDQLSAAHYPPPYAWKRVPVTEQHRVRDAAETFVLTTTSKSSLFGDGGLYRHYGYRGYIHPSSPDQPILFQNTSFMDLGVDIRCQIYRFMFPHGQIIEIRPVHKCCDTSGITCCPWRMHWALIKPNGDEVHRTDRIDDGSNCGHINGYLTLRGISHTIEQEVLGAFYGTNIFRFYIAKTPFPLYPGESKRLVSMHTLQAPHIPDSALPFLWKCEIVIRHPVDSNDDIYLLKHFEQVAYALRACALTELRIDFQSGHLVSRLSGGKGHLIFRNWYDYRHPSQRGHKSTINRSRNWKLADGLWLSVPSEPANRNETLHEKYLEPLRNLSNIGKVTIDGQVSRKYKLSLEQAMQEDPQGTAEVCILPNANVQKGRGQVYRHKNTVILGQD